MLMHAAQGCLAASRLSCGTCSDVLALQASRLFRSTCKKATPCSSPRQQKQLSASPSKQTNAMGTAAATRAAAAVAAAALGTAAAAAAVLALIKAAAVQLRLCQPVTAVATAAAATAPG